MKEPLTEGSVVVICITILTICFCGDPDLMDGIIAFLSSGVE